MCTETDSVSKFKSDRRAYGRANATRRRRYSTPIALAHVTNARSFIRTHVYKSS